MKIKRYEELFYDLSKNLTQEERDEGWHFCNDWDGLLLHTSWVHYFNCGCFIDKEEYKERTKHLSGEAGDK